MEVSNFELVYKPQSPVPPADTVLQGYFLEISNLEDREYLYTLDFVTSAITNPDRSLFSNTVIFVDTPSIDNGTGIYALTGTLASPSFGLGRPFAIPAKGTALVAMLPSDPFSMTGAPVTPFFECRGYVRLRLPAVLRRGGAGFFGFRPQSDRPVKVMLTPQFRATYLSAAGVINDQTQSSVPTASGRAVNDLPPDPPFVISLPNLSLAESRVAVTPESMMQAEPSAELLAALLAQIKASAHELDAFNATLAEAGVDLGLSPRKAGKP